jgi:hypothetical protein
VSWFPYALFVASCAALAGALVGIVLLFFKRWPFANRLAKRVTLLALGLIAVVVVELQLLSWAPQLAPGLLGLPVADVSELARHLAEAISELINCAALSVPAAVLGSVGWAVSRSALRAGGRASAAGSTHEPSR